MNIGGVSNDRNHFILYKNFQNLDNDSTYMNDLMIG